MGENDGDTVDMVGLLVGDGEGDIVGAGDGLYVACNSELEYKHGAYSVDSHSFEVVTVNISHPAPSS